MLDKRPEEEAGRERLELVRRAALAPSVASEVHSRWPDQLPKPATLHHFLVVEKKFNEESARVAIRILQENQSFAKLDEVAIQSPTEAAAEDSSVTEELVVAPAVAHTNVSGTARQQIGAVTQTAQARVSTPQAGAYVENIMYDADQRVQLSFSQEPDASVYDYIVEFATFRANVLRKREARALAQPNPPSAEPAQ